MAALGAVLLAGCTVGPDFSRPEAPAVKDYTPEALPAATATAPVSGGQSQALVPGGSLQADWWVLFRSEGLNQLVQTAVANSPNLAAAEAGLRMMRENLNAQTGALLLPAVNAQLQATRERISTAAYGAPNPSILD